MDKVKVFLKDDANNSVFAQSILGDSDLDIDD
jgi:hypothetical protein